MDVERGDNIPKIHQSLTEHKAPYQPLTQHSLNLLTRKIRITRHGRVLRQSRLNELLLALREPALRARALGPVGQIVPHCAGEEDGCQALENVDPAPGGEPADAVHVRDGVGEERAYHAGDSAPAEEVGDYAAHLIGAVPGLELGEEPGKHAGFEHTILSLENGDHSHIGERTRARIA